MEKDLEIFFNAIADWYISNKKRGVFESLTEKRLARIRKESNVSIETVERGTDFLQTKEGEKYFRNLLNEKATMAGLKI